MKGLLDVRFRFTDRVLVRVKVIIPGGLRCDTDVVWKCICIFDLISDLDSVERLYALFFVD